MSIQSHTDCHRYPPAGVVDVSVLRVLVAPPWVTGRRFQRPPGDGLKNAGSDFSLPANIGSLNQNRAIIKLDLKKCRLIGKDTSSAISHLFECLLACIDVNSLIFSTTR